MPFATDLPLPPSWTEPPALIVKAKVEMRKWGRVTLSDESGFKKVITSCLDVAGYTNINVEGDVLAYLGYRFDPKAWKYIPPLADDDVKARCLSNPNMGMSAMFATTPQGTAGMLTPPPWTTPAATCPRRASG